MEKIIIYNIADARKIITMAANMRIKSIVIDNTKLSDTLENVLAYSQDYRTDDIMPFINKDKSIVIFCDVTQKHLDKLLFGKKLLILGIGVNQYRLYEKGEVPSVSNGRMIRSIMNPKVMLDMIESSKHELSPQEYDKISEKVKAAISESENFKIAQYETKRIFTSPRGEENGFAPTSLTHLKNIMLNILNQCNGVWCTKMNKLLFYIDFYAYRERGYAMTGLAYKAIDFGPVPERWDRVYSEFSEISQDIQQCGDYEGSILHAHAPMAEGALSDEEIRIINIVCQTFGNESSREVSQISHNEDAWQNHHDTHERISFNDAFSLKAL